MRVLSVPMPQRWQLTSPRGLVVFNRPAATVAELAVDLGHSSDLRLIAGDWSRLQLLKSYGGGDWLVLLVR
jgi:hypothetical protein